MLRYEFCTSVMQKSSPVSKLAVRDWRKPQSAQLLLSGFWSKYLHNTNVWHKNEKQISVFYGTVEAKNQLRNFSTV